MNVGEIHGGKPLVEVDHPDYPAGMQGEGLGQLPPNQDMTVFDLLPDARIGADQRRVGDAVDTLNPADNDIRALQMKPYVGTITPEILKKLSDRGVDVGNIDPTLLAALATGSAGAAGGSLLFGGGDEATDDDQVLDHKRNGSRSPDEAGFPEWSRYEIGPSHGLPTPTWGDIGSTTMEVLDKPMTGLQGIVRGLYGLANGESLVEAGAQANHMMSGGSEEGFDRVGEIVESLLNPVDERFPYLKTGKAAGDTTSLGLSLLSPF